MRTYFKRDVDEVIEQEDIQDFLNKLMNMKEKVGSDLEVPADLQGLFLDLIKRQSRLYKLVDNDVMIPETTQIKIVREVIPAEFKPAGELTAEDAEKEADEYTVEFSFGSGHKVTKALFLPEIMTESEGVDIEYYVINYLTKSIAMALDNAILNGKGDAVDELAGIIPALPAENKKTVTLEANSSIIDLVKPINALDSGEYNENELVAIVNRDTYYSDVIEHLLNTNNIELLPRFIISQAMPKGKILYADLSKYFLLHRGNIRIENSTHVKFLNDEVAYLGTTGFQGKPTVKEAFVLVTLA